MSPLASPNVGQERYTLVGQRIVQGHVHFWLFQPEGFNRVLTRAVLSKNDRVWSSGVRGGGARPSEV